VRLVLRLLVNWGGYCPVRGFGWTGELNEEGAVGDGSELGSEEDKSGCEQAG